MALTTKRDGPYVSIGLKIFTVALVLLGAAALGVLMNTRGLMQLIVLTVGLELGVLTPTLFTIMVLMAIVTTVATTPILRRLIARPADGWLAH